MQKSNVSFKVTGNKDSKTDRSWTINVTNTSGILAFFIRPQIIAGGEEILPSMWSAGYFTLAPSETRTITVTCPKAALKEKEPEIRISGWNVE